MARSKIIDQTRLPHAVEISRLSNFVDAVEAIATMQVRGAPLIGVTAALGMAMAMRGDPSDSRLTDAAARLKAARPTAVNLAWAVDRLVRALSKASSTERRDIRLAPKPPDWPRRTSPPVGESAKTARR